MLGKFARLRGAAALLATGLIALPAGAFADTTIRMWTFLDPAGQTGRERVLNQLIEQFEDENPGVMIEVEPQVWQQMSDKFLAAHQTGTAPDVIWLHSTRVVDAIDLGALANLDELFVKDWSEEEIADIDGPFWQLGSTEDAHYHIVHSRSAVGNFYRKDLFDAAGIDPESVTTWDTFIDAAKTLTEKDPAGNVARYGFGQYFSTEGAQSGVPFNVIADRQGNILNEDGTANWATPAGVEAAELVKAMIREHGITPENAISLTGDDLYDQFNAGRYAIIRGSSARLPRAMEALGAEKVGYLPPPSFTEGESSPSEVVGWSAGVWSGSENLEMAGKWLEFFSSKEADLLWATVGGVVPIRRSTVIENPDIFSDEKYAYLAEVARAMSDKGWFAPGGVHGWNEEMNRAMQDILINDADPMEAWAEAEESFNRANRL